MADSSHGLSYHHLVNVAQWHISDDNYVAARAAIINLHNRHAMAALWDDGTTASSDGQYLAPASMRLSCNAKGSIAMPSESSYSPVERWRSVSPAAAD